MDRDTTAFLPQVWSVFDMQRPESKTLLFVGVLMKLFYMFVARIVCEMGKAEKSQYTGNVQVCVGVGECRPEFMAKSSKYYYFVVSML